MNLDNDSMIKQYLLGELTEEGQQQIEERLLRDGDYFEHLQLCEDELVDEYVRGGLPPDEQRRFDNHFLSTPERHEKLRFARALRRYVSAAVEAEPATTAQRTRLQFLSASLRGRHPVMAYSLAAALLLVLGGTVIFRNWQLQNQLAQIRSQQSAGLRSERELQRQLQEQRAGYMELVKELQHEKDQRAMLERKASSSITSNPDQLRAPIISLVLTPGLLRGEETTKKALVPSGATLIRLELHFPANDYRSWRATLHNAEGAELSRQSLLKARSAGGGGIVVMDLPAEAIPGGDYYVKLSGTAGSGEFEDIGKYYFRVTKK